MSVVRDGEKDRLRYTFVIDDKFNLPVIGLSISVQPDSQLDEYLKFGSGVVPLGEHDLLTKEAAIQSGCVRGLNAHVR